MLTAELRKRLLAITEPGRCVFDTGGRVAYSYDSQSVNALPEAVVTALSEDEIVSVVTLAHEETIPLVVRGAGSGMTGGAVPERGGIVLNLERMNRILGLSVEDRIGIVEPGVITADLQNAARVVGLYYPPEPASAKFSSLGGNVAESAGGLGCVKYGLTKHFIAGLRFVTARGERVATGVFSQSSAPFDVGAVLAGSEGTLAVVTAIALRLIPLPETGVTIRALFRTLADAGRASNRVLASGANPAMLEFMDRACIEAASEYAGITVADETGALLLVELEGDADEVNAAERRTLDEIGRCDPIEVTSAREAGERERLWKLRKSLSAAIARIAPLKFNEDVCVPLGAIPRVCSWVEDLGRGRDVRVVTFGHAGDGNIHVNFMTDRRRPEEVARVHGAVGELFRKVVAEGGTLSGEHGIGLAKREYIGIALDEAAIDFQRRIKRAFDPEGILNPGKMFPA